MGMVQPDPVRLKPLFGVDSVYVVVYPNLRFDMLRPDGKFIPLFSVNPVSVLVYPSILDISFERFTFPYQTSLGLI